MNSFYSTLENEIEKCKIVPRRSSVPMILNTRLFTQFLIVTHSRTAPFTPIPLVIFPPFELPQLPLSSVLQNCLPVDNSHDLHFSWRHELCTDEFVFRFKSGSSLFYGLCLWCSPPRQPLPFFATRETAKSQFCFCLITSSPVFTAHFMFLRHLLLLSVGEAAPYTQLADVPIAQIEIGSPLDEVNVTNQFAHSPDLSLPPAFQIEVLSYYEPLSSYSCYPLELPSSDDSVLAELWLSSDTLFSVLSPHEVIVAFAALLVDAQVLVVGSSLLEVSMTVMGLVALLQPMSFTGTFVPMLPDTPDYMAMLQTPTPFVIGCPATREVRKFAFPEGQSGLIIHLDNHAIMGRVSVYGNLPAYPNAAAVEAEIVGYLAGQERTAVPNPFGFPPELRKRLGHKYFFSEEGSIGVRAILQRPLANVFSDMLTCFFVTDVSADDSGVMIFNSQLFAASVDPVDAEFWAALTESQSFRVYVEKMIHEYEKVKMIVRGTRGDSSASLE
jgi:hypothetical protein